MLNNVIIHFKNGETQICHLVEDFYLTKNQVIINYRKANGNPANIVCNHESVEQLIISEEPKASEPTIILSGV